MKHLHKKQVIMMVAAVILAGVGTYEFFLRSIVPGSVSNGPTAGYNSAAVGNTELVVYVSGAVNKPGVLNVPVNSRVIDVINQAGGLATGADITKVNMAQAIKDGMQIYIPGGMIASGGTANSAQPAGKVNINSASKEEIDRLPGIGPTLAGRIVEYRQANGPFQNASDLKKVRGISESKLNQLKEKIVF